MTAKSSFFWRHEWCGCPQNSHLKLSLLSVHRADVAGYILEFATGSTTYHQSSRDRLYDLPSVFEVPRLTSSLLGETGTPSRTSWGCGALPVNCSPSSQTQCCLDEGRNGQIDAQQIDQSLLFHPESPWYYNPSRQRRVEKQLQKNLCLVGGRKNGTNYLEHGL